MIKVILVATLFFFGCIQYVFSSGKEFLRSLNMVNVNDYICYEFGASNIYYVVVTNEQSGYNIFLQEKDKKNWQEIYGPKIPILRWGFHEFPLQFNEIKESESKEDIGLFYSLSYIRNDSVIASVNNSIMIKDNVEFETKLQELIRYLTNLWVECIIKD